MTQSLLVSVTFFVSAIFTQAIEHASLISVLRPGNAHQHQLVLRTGDPAIDTLSLRLPQSATNIQLIVDGTPHEPETLDSLLVLRLPSALPARVQLRYEAETMDPPTIAGDVPIRASTREVYGPPAVQLVRAETEPPSWWTRLTRPFLRTASAMLETSQNLDWQITTPADTNIEGLGKIILTNDMLAATIKALQSVPSQEAINTLRGDSRATASLDGSTIRFESKQGDASAYALAKAYQKQRITEAELARQIEQEAIRRALQEQVAKTEAARLHLHKLAKQYGIAEATTATIVENPTLPSQDHITETTEAAPAPAPRALEIPLDYLPKLTQAQEGPWPAFDFQFVNRETQTRHAWFAITAGFVVLTIFIRVLRSRFRHFPLLRQ